ncbi:MAG: hypothetical protein JXA57_08110 [Armatimonadetes bacterium]|nr:hypothetical protein [Armatimonadota bacterium]
MMVSRFRTPRRRTTRQSSGFKVAGKKLGSSCKIEAARIVQPVEGQIRISAETLGVDVPQVFRRLVGYVGWGLYVKPGSECAYSADFCCLLDGESQYRKTTGGPLKRRCWNKLGALVEIPVRGASVCVEHLGFTLQLSANDPVSVFGALLGPLVHDYFVTHDLYDSFQQKLELYVPEILYLDPTTQATPYTVESGAEVQGSSAIVCKSCNRCSRFLPIDIDRERNTMSFSNHCVSRAPCTHSGFSRYRIDGGDIRLVSRHVRGGMVVSRLGHQLECKVCKKFYVNLPLNSKRNTTQHREDSLRRRALEVLVRVLLGQDWVYHAHRVKTGAEFDVSIWEKFGRKCFNCGKTLRTPRQMHLDHTLPLAYLWPLDSTATCLCRTCNSSKHDSFPVDFYSSPQLRNLSRLTRLPLSKLRSRAVNTKAVERLRHRIVWFFDEFLAAPDYQKVRNGKKAADLVLHAIQNVLGAADPHADLVALYHKKTGRTPKSVSIKK